MTTSSAQETYSITLDNDVISTLTSDDIITLSSTYSSSAPSYYTTSSGAGTINTITLTGGINCHNVYTTSTTCLSNINISGVESIWGGAEFVDSFPAWNRIEKMCAEYPGLKIAFEKFKTTYYLVKDDFDAPKDKK